MELTRHRWYIASLVMQKRKQSSARSHQRPVEILYEDRDIIVVDKAPGLLTMSTEGGRDKTAYSILTDHVRKGCARSSHRVFIVHRLDRETSGILVFAKNEGSKFQLQDNWDTTEKKYLAIVHGHPEKKSSTLSSYLAENKAFFVYSTPDQRLGKLSHTAYTVTAENNKFSLLEVSLLTGRKHQIRVHLSEIGHPVVGDEKYGRKNDPHKRLALHAKSLSFKHPFTGKPLSFETEVPDYFNWLTR